MAVLTPETSALRQCWLKLLLLGLTGLFAGFSGRGATFTASLDRDNISLGEMANLALTCNGGQPAGEPALPAMPNLQIAYVGPSSQFSVINGQVSSSVTYNFRVVPRQPGDYTIPAVTVEVAGQKLTSQPLTLRVTRPAPAPGGLTNATTQPALLKLVLPKKEFYVGESIAAQLQLYLSSRVQNVGNFQITTFPSDGFNVGKIQETQRRQTQVGNAVYTIIPINAVLTAIKPGSFTLGPVTTSVVLDLLSGNRRRDAFDAFFDRFNTEQQQAALSTEAESVQILPVPRENRPTDFNGAVGHFNLSVTAGPTNVTEGDPITVKIQISGRGAIDNLSLPELSWSNFVTHPPEVKVENTDQLGLQGTKSFEYIVSAQSSDIKELPPITFSFFDPDQKTFRTLSHAAIPLVVRGAGSTARPTTYASTPSRQEAAPPAPDIVPNKQRLGELAQISPPLIQQPWFLALQTAPVLAFLGSVAWRRRADKLATNPRLRRQRQVAKVIQDGLGQLRQLAEEKKSDEFFALVFRLLQEQLGERLDAPATSITEAVIDERLRPRGISEEILNPLQELFQLCNLARYAPIKTSQELKALVPKLESTLSQIREFEA